MGWTNSHLHKYSKNDTHYSERIPEDMAWDEIGDLDYLNIKLSDLLEKEDQRILYEYDFGDGWTHDLILEKILLGDNELEYPVCLAGEINCSPEDCGGISGFANILEILKNPDHEEYDSYIVWLGGKFNHTYFNIRKVNKLLRSKDYGCLELE